MSISGIVVDEITVVGSRCGPFSDALDALARHEVDLSNLIGRHLPLEKAQEAFDLAARGDVVKVLFDVS
jgi:threonine dehydrogenase-like Zn-dependent dehydrogenase